MATLKDMLAAEMTATYGVSEALMRKVDPAGLEWKPASGQNWMTVGQLLKHLSEACGMGVQGFVTGDWGMPEGMSMEDMLPTAEKLPTVASLDEALEALAQDKAKAFQLLEGLSETQLMGGDCTAPWGGPPAPLGLHLLHMVGHLAQHKAQLFYYLKLQGQPVHTGDLWGM